MKLWAAEEWIRQRHARSLEWYHGAGGLRRHGDVLLENVETEVAVQCILREDHPGWKKDDDNIVATLLLPSACLDEGNPRRNWNEYQHWDGHPLQGEYHCWLFHDGRCRNRWRFCPSECPNPVYGTEPAPAFRAK